MDNWDIRLKEQVDRKFENYKVFEINLATARIDDKLPLAGDFLYVESVSSESATATVKLNKNRNDAITLKHHRKIETVFTELHITNTAQAGETMTIVVGINFKLYDREGRHAAQAQPVVVVTNDTPDDDIQATTNVCDRVLLKASTKNTDTVWVDFGTAAVEDNCIPLEPGDSLTANASNTDRVHALFKVADEILFVIYEV